MKSNREAQKDYKSAGVDVETGDALVDWLQSEDQKNSVKIPHKDKIVDGIGGFASLFRFDQSKYKNPCLVSCTDGVGTKVLLAAKYGAYQSVAQDLVAMCVNDLICTGADPLFFLDYYATGKLNLDAAKEFLIGMRKACAESDCALIGGETAEMPGVYQPGDFDCAGFAVGVVDFEHRLGAHRVQDGDRVIGVSSSGCHSNGYSLIRKLFEQDMDQWKDKLLRPTHLYVKLAQEMRTQSGLKALAHMTGGGIENVPRVLPDHLEWKIRTWEFNDLYKEIQKRSDLSTDAMLKTFNCGVGLSVIVEKDQVDSFSGIIQKHGFDAIDIGHIGAKA